MWFCDQKRCCLICKGSTNNENDLTFFNGRTRSQKKNPFSKTVYSVCPFSICMDLCALKSTTSEQHELCIQNILYISIRTQLHASNLPPFHYITNIHMYEEYAHCRGNIFPSLTASIFPQSVFFFTTTEKSGQKLNRIGKNLKLFFDFFNKISHCTIYY